MISYAWESLTGDPLPWLLDTRHPNIHWRALVELVRRPAESPAVVRARSGSNAADPVATLLADLRPDGGWPGEGEMWERWSGPGWRLLAAAQLGADPSDPRLHAAVENLLESASGEGGFALEPGEPEIPWLTARVLQTLAELGWCRHARFQEALAWLEEGASPGNGGGWSDQDADCPVTPVALLATLTACGENRREALHQRAARSIISQLAAGGLGGPEFGHPNFDRTDGCEALWALARANVDLDPRFVPALVSLQAAQLGGGRWARGSEVPPSLPVGPRSPEGQPSRWLTLHAAVAVLHYAVEAELPRMYPRKPD